MKEYIEKDAARDLMERALEDDWEIQYANDRLRDIPAADVVEAAEAIEEMLGKPNGKWVPATELPPKGVTYGDTTFSVDVLGMETFTCRKAYYNFMAKVWLGFDGNAEEVWPSITHWMPLPEPSGGDE